MGRADSDNAGGSGRGGGGVGGGGSSGGGRGGGFDGRDTPGSPNAADGKRGSTMGRDGGRATGGGSSSNNNAQQAAKNKGRDTPGAPSNVGRRGDHAAGSTASSRARDAMSRHSAERNQRSGGALAEADLGIGEGYSHPDAIAERAKTGMVSPREMDMARGYNSGRTAALAEQTVGGTVSDVVGRLSQTPGVGGVAKRGVGVLAGGASSTPEEGYGTAVARNRTENSAVQSAAQMGAGIVGGPVAGKAAGMINTAINANKTSDIGEMADALGLNNATQAPAGSGNGPQRAASAMQAPTAPAAPATQSFEWNPVNIDEYSKGLLMQAQG